VHEGEHEEGVCSPSVEDLDFLVRDSRDEGDPVCLACGRAVMCQYLNRVWALGKRTRRTAYMPAPASPTECPVAVSRRSLHSASSTVVGWGPCLRVVTSASDEKFNGAMPYKRRTRYQQHPTAEHQLVRSSTGVLLHGSHDTTDTESTQWIFAIFEALWLCDAQVLATTRSGRWWRCQSHSWRRLRLAVRRRNQRCTCIDIGSQLRQSNIVRVCRTRSAIAPCTMHIVPQSFHHIRSRDSQSMREDRWAS